ncbi:hypothetical protein LSS_00445 [Leptospira santarosai serovar Shermani str. LT 821]|uniref:Uncharacterized protein n=1 Tax=Leptospira santarosai serovar Shermani str. LT 821 TaxID=758847 RepID=K8YHP1_9LEPT|nr:hypothetical protein LSS_00445 [Leptospira santarosai serovar Shermani str. LT 821]
MIFCIIVLIQSLIGNVNSKKDFRDIQKTTMENFIQ